MLQVQQSLAQLLMLGGAAHALDALRPGGPMRISVDLVSGSSRFLALQLVGSLF